IVAAKSPCAKSDDGNSEALGFDRLHYFLLAFRVADETHSASHFGACGGFTTRKLVALSFLSSVISVSESLKSNTSRFCFKCSEVAVRGIEQIPFCTKYRSETCAALFPWVFPMRSSASTPEPLPRAIGK